MPNKNSHVSFIAGTHAKYTSLTSKDANSIYFCTDTKQLFVGEVEYTKGTLVLSAQPTESTKGDDGRLYVYNGMLFLCQYVDGTTYNWTKVANVNNAFGTVKSITAGDGLDTSADTDNPITTTGTIIHKVPEGAQVVEDGLEDQTPQFGNTFNIQSVETDKFGHVIAVNTHTVKLPSNPLPSDVSVDYDATSNTVTFS